MGGTRPLPHSKHTRAPQSEQYNPVLRPHSHDESHPPSLSWPKRATHQLAISSAEPSSGPQRLVRALTSPSQGPTLVTAAARSNTVSRTPSVTAGRFLLVVVLAPTVDAVATRQFRRPPVSSSVWAADLLLPAKRLPLDCCYASYLSQLQSVTSDASRYTLSAKALLPQLACYPCPRQFLES